MVSRFTNIKEALRVLSLKADEQIAYLERIGLISIESKKDDLARVDEIALQFEDYYLPLVNTKFEFESHDDMMNMLTHIYDVFYKKSFPEHDSFWTIYSLKLDDQWESIRQVAKRCLILMNEIV